MDERKVIEKQREETTKRAIDLYHEIEDFLNSDEYNKDLREDLALSIPKYPTVIDKRRIDLEKTDHGIVVAGETSSGKTTLINKILEMKLFKGRLAESTSTICKIRNSDRIRIITKGIGGKTEEEDLTDSCDIGTKKGVAKLRYCLKDKTDLPRMSKAIQDNFQSVDIELPVPFLRGNTILVDTPGIGGSGNVTQKLIEYIPNALAFIFVIDVSSAGGMQYDRLPGILKKITDLKKNSDMPCFNPENVIFITNKWDLVMKQIESSDEDDSADDEPMKTWEVLKSDIKQNWPVVRENNIFQMILKQVSPMKTNEYTTPFQEFKQMLESFVKKAENLRVVEHTRFLLDTVNEILKGLDKRISFGKMSEREQNELIKKTEKEIERLNTQCKQVKAKFGKIIEKDIDEMIQECDRYMSTDEGKNKIMNPAGQKSLSEINWNSANFEATIKSRVDLYATRFVKSDAVSKRYEKVVQGIQTFYRETVFDIKMMKNDWTRIQPSEEIESHFLPIKIGFMLYHLLVPAFADRFGIPIAIIGGCALAAASYLVWVSKTPEQITDEYNKCKKTALETIRKYLQSNYDLPLNKMIEKVSDNLLRSIQKFETQIQNFSGKRDEIIKNLEELASLVQKVSVLKKRVEQLGEDLKFLEGSK